MYINTDIIRAIHPSSLKCQPFLISKSSLSHQQKKTWPIHWVSSLKLTAATSAKIFNWGFVYIAAVCCLVSCSIRKEWPRLLRERAPLFKKNRRVIVEEQHSELFDRSKMVQRFTIPKSFSKQVTQCVFCGPFCFDLLALPSKKASKMAVLCIYLAEKSQITLKYQILDRT